jgi:integrase
LERENEMVILDDTFYWKPITITIERQYRSNIVKEDTVIIALTHKKKKTLLPHPISIFIKRKFKMEGVSYQTQLKAARVICGFLNFILNNITDEVKGYESLSNKGLKGLQLIHGAQYISHCTYIQNNSNTVRYKESVLASFYEFLKVQRVLDEDFPLLYRDVGKRGQPVPLSPFSSSILEVQRPSIRNDAHKDKLKDFGDNRYLLVKEFIEEAEGSGIELGIALQFFGGLRVGEVVNLMEDNIFQNGFRGDSGFWVQVKDNQSLLFEHLSIKNHVQVKRPRNQVIMENDLLNRIYEKHLKKVNILKKQNTLQHEALFISSRNGMPISGDNYIKKFKRIKGRFIQRLRNSRRYEDVEFLESAPWSTHIGRGVFTNFLIDKGLLIQEIANLRGDKTLTATLSYIEKRTSLEKMKKHMDTFSEVFGRGN